jgi:hypothetical protein
LYQRRAIADNGAGYFRAAICLDFGVCGIDLRVSSSRPNYAKGSDELCAFPNGAHNDQVDAASAAFRALIAADVVP